MKKAGRVIVELRGDLVLRSQAGLIRIVIDQSMGIWCNTEEPILEGCFFRVVGFLGTHPSHFIDMFLSECSAAEHDISYGDNHYAAKSDDAYDGRDCQVPFWASNGLLVLFILWARCGPLMFSIHWARCGPLRLSIHLSGPVTR